MEKDKTHRGFDIYEFKDLNRVECSLQKSSLATEDAIWLGANEIGLQEFRAGEGWKEVNLPNQHVANNRMHLTQEQVAKLLPILTKFVETGEI